VTCRLKKFPPQPRLPGTYTFITKEAIMRNQGQAHSYPLTAGEYRDTQSLETRRDPPDDMDDFQVLVNDPLSDMLGARLRMARHAKHLTYDELSQLSGISRVWLIAVENGLYRFHEIQQARLRRLEQDLGLAPCALSSVLDTASDETPARRPCSDKAVPLYITELHPPAAPIPYFGAGHRLSRPRSRSLRHERDLAHLYFDK
jgi:transcriptional regulator with XRE-family HTH domain